MVKMDPHYESPQHKAAAEDVRAGRSIDYDTLCVHRKTPKDKPDCVRDACCWPRVVWDSDADTPRVVNWLGDPPRATP